MSVNENLSDIRWSILLWISRNYVSHPISSLFGIHLVRIHPVTIWQSRRRDQVRLRTIVMLSCLMILLIGSIWITSIELILILFDLSWKLVRFHVVHLTAHRVVVVIASLLNLVELFRLGIKASGWGWMIRLQSLIHCHVIPLVHLLLLEEWLLSLLRRNGLQESMGRI